MGRGPPLAPVQSVPESHSVWIAAVMFVDADGFFYRRYIVVKRSFKRESNREVGDGDDDDDN